MKTLLSALLLPLAGLAAAEPDYVTPREKILEAIAGPLPSQGGKLPNDIASRLGAAHVAGKYFFMAKPYLIAGAEDLRLLGFRGAKFWFANVVYAYPWHSEWNLPANYTLVDLARHPYFEEVFAMPFEVFALEVQPVGKPVKDYAMDPGSNFAEDEKQVYGLASYLLAKFKDRKVTFILQNWEGDWMLRGGARDQWAKGEYPDLDRRVDAFIRWLNARQRGVERARAEHPGSLCRVLHAVEVNQVLATWQGVPTLASHVLPKAKTDLVAWSCFDGMHAGKKSTQETAVGLWQGIETIRHFARQAHGGKDVPVYIGEIGIPEQKGFRPEEITAIWDGAFAALFALDVPYVFQWQLYDNEIRDDVKKEQGSFTSGDLNGFWLRKPNGSLSPTGEYFERLLGKTNH